MMWLFAVSTYFCSTCFLDMRYLSPSDSLSILIYIYISSIPIYLTFSTVLTHPPAVWKLGWSCTCSYLSRLSALPHIYLWSICLLAIIWQANFETLFILYSPGTWNRIASPHLPRTLYYFPSSCREFLYFKGYFITIVLSALNEFRTNELVSFKVHEFHCIYKSIGSHQRIVPCFMVIFFVKLILSTLRIYLWREAFWLSIASALWLYF